ncbi:TniQ family protein [Mesorhizobium sp. ES1-4]|uniref:TniQ family protein n=1 Tax=Mesorhizobium sp. ES1-4 TaxID=2876627 RepID=UPI001CC8ED90|nr:TniQ family protein [Mesorhizobium sp. ES1-4]MBZ9797754.1 TniQ family protein [Mesorhizobium sp. ES1-4]
MLDRVGSGIRVPAVSRWGIEPLVDEPAHGFFLRLAALNGQLSIRPFAMALGLNGRNIKPQEMLSFCEELPILGLDMLRNSTPHLTETVVFMRGQRLRFRRDWSITHRRYCPECIKESSHHRFWFDLVVSRYCPVHGSELRTDKNGMIWAWGRSGPSLEDSEKLIASSAGAFSRYLGGRVGVCEPSNVLKVDSLELDDAIYLCIVIGNILLHGWRNALPKCGWLEAKQNAVERGFEFLAAGGSIEDLCEHYLRSTPYLVSGRFTCTDTPKVLGWLYSAKTNKIHEQGIASVRNCIDRLVVEYGACRRLRRKFPPSQIEHDTAAAAAQLGLTRAEVLKIASWDPDKKPSSTDLIPHDVSVDAVARKARLLCAPKEAASILGVTPKQLGLLYKSGVVNSVFAATPSSRSWYEREVLEKVVSRALSRHTGTPDLGGGLTLDQFRAKALCSYPDAVKLVLDDKVTVSELSQEGCGLAKLRLVPPPAARMGGRTARFIVRRKLAPPGYLTMAKAASLMSVSPHVVAKLAGIGALEHRVTNKRISSVTQTSVEAFARHHVTAQAVALQLGYATATAVRNLRDLGVPIQFDVRKVGACFVKRRDVEAAIGEPLQQGSVFFQGLQRAILRSEFAHHLEWIPGNSHAFLAGMGGKVRLIVELWPDNDTVRLVLPFKGARRQRVLGSRITELVGVWSHARVTTLQDGDAALAEEYRLPHTAGFDSSVFAWMESRVLLIRTVLGRG